MAAQEDVLVAGRYRLVDRIGSGGMSTVWSAWDERLHRKVAVKQLRLQQGLSDHEARLAADRTMREARITARLHHPHAVPVYDVVDHGDTPCLVMQYLSARSLQTVLAERGTLDVREVARIGSEVASALAAAHEAGIVHRDVKPGNILIDDEGSAKITDFGISHAMGDVTLTSTGMVTGTPAYLSPEAARGEESGYPADVFSLGATLFTALEGVPPVGRVGQPDRAAAPGRLRQAQPPVAYDGPDAVARPDARPRPRAPPADVRGERAAREDRARRRPGRRRPGATAGRREPAPPSTTVMLPAARPDRRTDSAPPDRPLTAPASAPAQPRRRGPWMAGAVVAALLLLLGGVSCCC